MGLQFNKIPRWFMGTFKWEKHFPMKYVPVINLQSPARRSILGSLPLGALLRPLAPRTQPTSSDIVVTSPSPYWHSSLTSPLCRLDIGLRCGVGTLRDHLIEADLFQQHLMPGYSQLIIVLTLQARATLQTGTSWQHLRENRMLCEWQAL